MQVRCRRCRLRHQPTSLLPFRVNGYLVSILIVYSPLRLDYPSPSDFAAIPTRVTLDLTPLFFADTTSIPFSLKGNCPCPLAPSSSPAANTTTGPPPPPFSPTPSNPPASNPNTNPTPAPFASLANGNFQVVVLYTQGDFLNAPAVETLTKFVRNSGGLLAIHSANASITSKPLAKLIGSRFKGHGPRLEFTVKISDPDHPIAHRIQPFRVDDELYALEKLTDFQPFLTTWADNKPLTLGYSKTEGKGRVDFTSLTATTSRPSRIPPSSNSSPAASATPPAKTGQTKPSRSPPSATAAPSTWPRADHVRSTDHGRRVRAHAVRRAAGSVADERRSHRVRRHRADSHRRATF